MRVHGTREHEQPGGVEHFGAVTCKLGLQCDDPPVNHTNIERGRRPIGDDLTATDNEVERHGVLAASLVSPRTKAYNTSSATLASAGVTASAGLWLSPPVQRTNSIAIGQSADSATPS